ATEPTTGRPDPVSHRAVNEQRPQDHEDKERAELCALSKGASDEGRRDDGEHALEDDECLVGDRTRVGPGLRSGDVRQEYPREVSDETPVVRPEGQAVTHSHEDDGDHAEHEEALHDRGEYVLTSCQASV